MELKLKENSPQPLIERVAVPVSQDMKRDLETLKNVLEVNDMTREFFEELIKKAKTNGLTG